MHPFHKFVEPPYIPGPEAAGDVVEVGAGVEGFRVGQRVCGRAMGGAYARLVRLGAPWTLNLPDVYGYAEGAGIAVQFITAWNAVVIYGRAAAGRRFWSRAEPVAWAWRLFSWPRRSAAG